MVRTSAAWKSDEICLGGSKELDFQALETAATYQARCRLRRMAGQDGFTASSEPVRWFWEVVHNLNPEEKKSLLQPHVCCATRLLRARFCTGCDRAPVGGLGGEATLREREICKVDYRSSCPERVQTVISCPLRLGNHQTQGEKRLPSVRVLFIQ